MTTTKSIAEIWWERLPREQRVDRRNRYYPLRGWMISKEIEKVWQDEGQPEPRELTYDEMKNIAYTNTYNLDINPEAVPDLLDVLKKCVQRIEYDNAPQSKACKRILKDANASIEKAKLPII